ncbi:MAG: hypothetical protein IK079_06335 [Desulfovibrio sp.]|nr:hypothetical protein [Desulfovibrio sp.]
MLNNNISVVSNNIENNTKTERLIHMSRYLEFLTIVQEFQAITDPRSNCGDDAVNDLIAKMEAIATYLNEIAERYEVKNLVPPCSSYDFDDSGHLPLIEGYLRIRLEAMKMAFIEIAWAIDDFNLPDALEQIDRIIDEFTDD